MLQEQSGMNFIIESGYLLFYISLEKIGISSLLKKNNLQIAKFLKHAANTMSSFFCTFAPNN